MIPKQTEQEGNSQFNSDFWASSISVSRTNLGRFGSFHTRKRSYSPHENTKTILHGKIRHLKSVRVISICFHFICPEVKINFICNHCDHKFSYLRSIISQKKKLKPSGSSTQKNFVCPTINSISQPYARKKTSTIREHRSYLQNSKFNLILDWKLTKPLWKCCIRQPWILLNSELNGSLITLRSTTL